MSVTRILGCAAVAVGLIGAVEPASASERRPAAQRAGETAGVGSLGAALARAFQSNPDIVAGRAALRGTRESIAIARAGGLPQVGVATYGGVNAVQSLVRGQVNGAGALVPGTSTLWQTGVGLTGSQTVFDGFRTPNAIDQAESGTLAAREQLRAIEQAVLLDVATTYLAVGAGQALVDVQRRNTAFLREVLDNARTRFGAGVATPTDVSQAEARLSRGQSDLAAAETQLQIARDRFVRLVGAPPAARLEPVRAVDALIPRSREASRDLAGRENPAVLAARAALDAAEAAVRVAQAQMLPNLTVNAALARDLNTQPDTIRQDQAAIVGRLNVPIFQGGAPEAQVRQAREFQRAAQAQLDGARLQARSAGFAGHAAFLNAAATIRAATDEVRAAEAAVDGVRRQVESGIRTTVDLLNAQQDVVLARSRLIVANADRLVASYTVLAATGRLEFERLGLRRPAVAEAPVQPDANVRFDAWRDMRRPTGPAGPPSLPDSR